MKFRSKETGEVFTHNGTRFCGRFVGKGCTSCPVRKPQTEKESCEDWVLAHPGLAASLMGYELLNDDGQPVPGEENIPVPEYNPGEVAFRSTEPDMVDHPSHYTQGGIECIDALTAMISPYKDPNDAALSWQVVKYIWRHPFKGKPLEDLRKARFYLNRLIERYEKGEIPLGG